MKCMVGIDLGSTTTKAVLLDANGAVVGQGITNSRSNYHVACAVAREEALAAARFTFLRRALRTHNGAGEHRLEGRLLLAFRLELYLDELRVLRERIGALARLEHGTLAGAAGEVLDGMERDAPGQFLDGASKKSDFFRDLAGAAYMAGAERASRAGAVPFERLMALFDRAILDVETQVRPVAFGALLRRAAGRLPADAAIDSAVAEAESVEIEEVAFAGTGYGRQTLPFPKEAVKSEILCHGRGAHRIFPGTRTVLDIGGQDTKAIQVDEHGVVTAFQMNDRCAAGCGRYLGYVADELNLGLHELGPLAMKACRVAKVNSTCTVFAGAELRERIALGQPREEILAGLHRGIMLRAMALLARSGGVKSEFTFTGGVCKNGMATRVLRELVGQSYGEEIVLNTHPDSIYMGALGAALFALDDFRAGRGRIMGEAA